MDIESRPREAIELEDLEYHPLIQARLRDEIEHWRDKLESVSGEDLAQVQGMVTALRLMLALPEKLVLEERSRKGIEIPPASQQRRRT